MRVLLLLVLCAVCLPAQESKSSSDGIWSHLKKAYDNDGDGVVTKVEYQRGDRAFRNLDRNRDGKLSVADFERPKGGQGKGAERSPREEAAHRLGDLYGSFINLDGKPGLSQDDWSRLMKALKPAQGVVPAKNLDLMFGRSGEGRMARMGMQRLKGLFDRDEDGSVEVEDLGALFSFLDVDGNGVIDQGTEIDLPPGVGERAPDFTLPRLGNTKAKVQLSAFTGKKPVVLIFGSYT